MCVNQIQDVARIWPKCEFRKNSRKFQTKWLNPESFLRGDTAWRRRKPHPHVDLGPSGGLLPRQGLVSAIRCQTGLLEPDWHQDHGADILKMHTQATQA